jgi:hypothetical protein
MQDLIGRTLGHYRVAEQAGRLGAPSGARSLDYARDKLREVEGSPRRGVVFR